jgi:hypothetical protein
LYQFTRRAIKLTVVLSKNISVIKKFIRNFSSVLVSRLSSYVNEIIIDQLLIRFIAFARCWKNGSTMRPMKLIRLIKTCFNKTHIKVHVGKHFSDTFPIQNGLNKEML